MPESTHPPESIAVPSTSARRRMTTRQRLLFLLTGWLIVLMPFLFWWNTWFGRHLTDQQITEYLRDDKHPRHIQHALIQIGDRMQHRDADVKQWYPELVRLSSYSVEEVRNTDAWIMGQDNSSPDFHAALLKMLNDSSLMVRGNAALSLVRFGDASGRQQLVALLQPIKIVSPANGKISDTATAGTAIHQAGLIAKLQHRDRATTQEVRSPITGRVRSLEVKAGQQVEPGTEIAVVDPDTEQVWEALRGLYAIGQLEDLPAVTPYERELPDIPDRVRQQAKSTEEAIRSRSK
jgi:HlyD family secretion protein